jgi:hypothetical protein
MFSKGLRLIANNAVGFLALFIALGGVGYAATGGFSSSGTLRACANEEGRLKLLKSSERCKRGQKSVSWNQTGPAGAPGAKGVAGAAGAAGTAGAQGSQGGQGPQGTALAYAHVSQTGVLDTAHSKNVSTASQGGTGIFCLTVTVPVTNVTGTEDLGSSLVNGNVVAALAGQGEGAGVINEFCPDGTNALIVTEKGEIDKNLAFWVSFN